ncbi:MAG: hypothetical protein WBP25_08465, partial [Giesbergeria sp.]
GRGWLMLVSGRLQEAVVDFRRSLELNPNDAVTLARLGISEAVSGDPAGGVARCMQAIRLSPRDPARFHLLDNLVWAQFAAQAYGDAIHTAEQSLREADFAGTRLCLVLCLVGAGQLERALPQAANHFMFKRRQLAALGFKNRVHVGASNLGKIRAADIRLS